MSGALTDEQREPPAVVRALFDKESPESVVRATMETDLGYDPALWATTAELGLLGLARAGGVRRRRRGLGRAGAGVRGAGPGAVRAP